MKGDAVKRFVLRLGLVAGLLGAHALGAPNPAAVYAWFKADSGALTNAEGLCPLLGAPAERRQRPAGQAGAVRPFHL